MHKAFIFCALFLASSLNLMANNREPYSPSGNYKFSLNDIQTTVREALIKADKTILEIATTGEIDSIAQLYFNQYLNKISTYNISPVKTVDLVEAYKTELVNAFVLKEFKERFPHLIHDRSQWFFNTVGGMYAPTLLLYATNKEYIVLWGSVNRADNKFSGYYSFMNEFDVMVRGTMTSHDIKGPGHVSVVYKPYVQDGLVTDTVDTSNLIPKNARSYSLDAHTYMISYAQGNILKAFFPGAIMPGIFVTQDWGGLAAHIKESYRSFMLTKKKYRKTIMQEQANFQTNPNYRAIWIIDGFRAGQSSK